MQFASQIFPNLFNGGGVDFLVRRLHNGDMGWTKTIRQWGMGLTVWFSSVAFGAAPLLIGESSAEVEDRPLAPRSGHFQVGAHMASNLPLSRPFKTSGGQPFQFQVSRAMGLEIEMGWSSKISFSVSSGWESFETRLDTSAGVNTEFQTASVSMIPVVFAAKYRFRESGWTPEVEAGIGMGLYRFTLDSTNQSSVADKASTASFLAHALVGARFHWNKDWSLGFHVGYRYSGVGQQDLNNGIRQVESSSFTGLITRGTIAFRF
jgi:hypothetical protein